MRQRFIYHDDSGILEVIATGQASLEGDVGLIQALLMHPRFHRGIPVLLDQTGLEIGHLSERELRQVADLCVHVADTLGDGHCAILVDSELAFGLGRQWEAYLDERVAFRTRVFLSREEALAWLKTGGS